MWRMVLSLSVRHGEAETLRGPPAAGPYLRSRRHTTNRSTLLVLRPRWTPGSTPLALRPRRPSRSPPPAPPSAPILGLPLRTTDCAKQPLDRLLHLFADDVADEGDEVRRSRHGPSLGARYCAFGRRCPRRATLAF